MNSFKTRIGTYTGAKVADFQAVQIKMAEARCLIDSATHLMRQSALGFEDFANRNAVPEIELKLRWRAQNAFAVRQARQAVETLWSCYGANAIYTRDPLQRYLRDLQALGQHFSFNFDIAGAAYGMLALGGKYTNPTM
jgi:3-hydroxy-9,10-secoandrosta-1,3,5(10)-triene-9,17-dione monooxygenase